MEEESESIFASFFSRLFGGREHPPVEDYILAAKKEGTLRPAEVSMLLNVLRLGRKQVREIMIPRTDIVCAEVSEPISSVSELIISHGHSRIPVYRENRDHIVGIIHAKDLILPQSCDHLPDSADIMREPLFIPETKNVYDMLQVFRERKIHLAIALDEYGGTSGLVTFEDVLEEIVGEIEDEYDEPRPEDIQVIEGDTVLVAGRTTLDEIAEDLDIVLDSEQVETVSGYLCELAGRVPGQGETFRVQDHSFLVKEADAKQVHWIVIQPLADQPPKPADKP